MKILSWNVAGLRACIKKGGINFLETSDYDIVCFQETKAEEQQVKLPTFIEEKYPFRYWKSTQGITQRKGLSGTTIWSRFKPFMEHKPPHIDLEGRVTTLEFAEFILITVYTPNSQRPGSERCKYRTIEWDITFNEYIHSFDSPVIVCGDFNVANHDIDIYSTKGKKNKIAGFLDIERENFRKYLDGGFTDIFRTFNSNKNQFTYWDQRHPQLRENNKGWRIDYFLIEDCFVERIIDSKIHPEIYGSDHCPISITISNKYDKKLFKNRIT